MPQKARPEQLLATILETTEDAVLCVSPEGRIETWSKGAEATYGYSAEEMVGQSLARLTPLYEGPKVQEWMEAAQQGKTPGDMTTERLHRDGSRICMKLKHAAIHDEHGEITGLLERGVRVNLPFERRRGGAPAETGLRLLVEQMPVVLWTTDQRLRITSNWGSGFQLSRIRASELAGRTIFEYLKCNDPSKTPVAEHYAALRGESSHFEYKRGGRVMDIRMEPLRDASGEIIGCIGVGLDVTERKRSEDEIRYQATHDALTGLANYREFLETLEREVRRAERSRHGFSILLLDLDELKRINDRNGHLAGNRALKRLATVMKQHCRSTDLPARYGGDEFAVVLIDSDARMAEQVAERIETCLRSDGEQPVLSVSIGMSVYPGDGRTAQDLLEAADRELYRRKRASRSRTVVTN